MAFVKAQKYDSKLRMAIAGPAGSGKTFTALTLAMALADGKTVGVIDTERGSASKYADIFPEFDVNVLESFSPESFIAAIREAEQAGYAVLVIDSISHEWNGAGGVLEIVDAAAKRMKTANTFSAWGEGTPKHNSFIDAILRSRMHVICTMRSKEDHIQERVNDRTVIRRVGMAPIQRDGIMYEFDIAAELDYEHTMLITKSRCSLLADEVIRKPDGKVADTLKAWLSGAPAPVLPIAKDRLNALYTFGKSVIGYSDVDGFADAIKTALGLDAPIDVRKLTEPQARDFEDYVRMRDLQAASEKAAVGSK